jgi:DNA-binding NtrC family response regulator
MPDRAVFLVDDDAAVRQGLRFMLRTAGYSVEAFPSARSFLADYDPRRGGWLLLDLPMPPNDRTRTAVAAQYPPLAYPGNIHDRPSNRPAGDCSEEGRGFDVPIP